jgi:DNA-binding transcriptional LysR family regulator
MDTVDITLIRTLAEAGSLTRAAEAMHQSQPTLSRKLARLESRLNTPLFHRSPTGMVPTDVSRYIIEAARPLDTALKKIERHVEQLTQLETGEVRLGVGPIIEQVLLPEVLGRFVEETGQVRINTVTDHADTLIELLRSGRLDVIAGPFRAADFPDLVGFPLISDSLVTVARAGHPLFEPDNGRTPQDYPLAAPLPQGSLSSSDAQVPDNQRIASDNYPLLIRVALSSDCICRGPRPLFQGELDCGALREVRTRRSVTWHSTCLIRPESNEAPLVKFLVRLLVEGSKQYGRET